jgi:hypothetical protein
MFQSRKSETIPFYLAHNQTKSEANQRWLNYSDTHTYTPHWLLIIFIALSALHIHALPKIAEK